MQKHCIFVKDVPNFLISSGSHHPGWVLGDLWWRLEHMVEFGIGLSIHFVSGQLSVKPFETMPVLIYSYMIATSCFLKKSFSASQYIVLSWMWWHFWKIHPLGINGLRRRFGQNLLGPPKIQKKSKTLETKAHCFTLVPSFQQKYETWDISNIS